MEVPPKAKNKADMVVQTCNASTQEVEARGSGVLGQLVLHSETLSQNKLTNKTKNRTFPSYTIPEYISEGSTFLMFIAALFTSYKLWNQPRCLSTVEWLKKIQYIYTK
jgi:hypothetical protein